MIEKKEFLFTQLITYLGNKRALLFEIEKMVKKCTKRINKEKCICADLFSGSGVVSRMLKKHSSKIIANDLEEYAKVLNECYLTNEKDFNNKFYDECRNKIIKSFSHEIQNENEGIICKNYAPKNDEAIKIEERVFYTRENALRIDAFRKLIDEYVPKEMQKYFLAPLLTECSVHTNTSGVFKGFYKDKKTGIGCFGGTGKNALSRILKPIELPVPVFSRFESNVEVFQKDAVELSQELKKIDIAYLDPPYNQHPYGSNYFMLNVILKNKIEGNLSNVSGIVSDWNRSNFNKPQFAMQSMENIISNLDAKFIIISYNSEGFISFNDMKNMLKKYGIVETVEMKYNTFRGSRNLRETEIHVREFLFVLEKF